MRPLESDHMGDQNLQQARAVFIASLVQRLRLHSPTPGPQYDRVLSLCLHVLSRMPKSAREDFLARYPYVFWCSSAAGMVDQWYAPREGLYPFVLLAADLPSSSDAQSIGIVAHEFAHVLCGPGHTCNEAEIAADALASSWGFAEEIAYTRSRYPLPDVVRRDDAERLASWKASPGGVRCMARIDSQPELASAFPVFFRGVTPETERWRALCAQVLSRLPEQPRRDLLGLRPFVLISGRSLSVQGYWCAPSQGHYPCMSLPADLSDRPDSEVLGAVAHQFALLLCRCAGGSQYSRRGADALAASWGFDKEPGVAPPAQEVVA